MLIEQIFDLLIEETKEQTKGLECGQEIANLGGVSQDQQSHD